MNLLSSSSGSALSVNIGSSTKSDVDSTDPLDFLEEADFEEAFLLIAMLKETKERWWKVSPRARERGVMTRKSVGF